MLLYLNIDLKTLQITYKACDKSVITHYIRSTRLMNLFLSE
jgi:hypothetical protein